MTATLTTPEARRADSPSASNPRRVLVALRWPVGGIRTHVLYNYPAAAERGYRFTFVGPDDASFNTFAAGLRDLPDCEFVGARVRGSSCHLMPAVSRLLRARRFDLLHSHGLTAAFHVVLANVGHGLSHVATVHDPLRADQFAGLRGRGKRWLMGRMLRCLDAAVCVSADIRANLLEYLPTLRRSRLVTIPNGIDVDCRNTLSKSANGELRRGLGLEPNVALLGFLGRFMVQKGFLPLLQALQALLAEGAPRPFHLVAVGSGDFEREYRAEIQRRGLHAHVSMLDFVMDARPLLEQLDLLVVPSLWEASPLLPMEAMTVGIPVLGTDCIGLREILRDTPSRTVAAGDAEALRDGLRSALTAPWTAEARDYAATARERFDNRRSAQRLIELFGQLVRS